MKQNKKKIAEEVIHIFFDDVLKESFEKIRYKMAYYNWIKEQCIAISPESGAIIGAVREIQSIATDFVDANSKKLIELSKDHNIIVDIELFTRGEDVAKTLGLGFTNWADQQQKIFDQLVNWPSINGELLIVSESILKACATIEVLALIFGDPKKTREGIDEDPEFKEIYKVFRDWEYTLIQVLKRKAA